MANYNHVALIGRLTRDPELRYTNNGTAVTEISLAINREFNVSDGTRKKETCFVDCVLWARRAEVACQYLKKGAPIFIEGRLELDKWTTPEGDKRSRLRVVGEQFQFLDKSPKNGNDDTDATPTEGQEGDASWDAAAAGVPEEDATE